MGGIPSYNDDARILGDTDETLIGNLEDRLKVVSKKDKTGTTDSYIGNVGTTAIQIPTVAGTVIDEILIICATDQSTSRDLLFSLDGVNYAKIQYEGSRFLTIRGSLRQIWIKSRTLTTDYEIFLNRGAT